MKKSANTHRRKKESGLAKIAICGGMTEQSHQRSANDMTVIKTAGRIMGAKLSKTEQRAMDMEIGRQAAEFERRVEKEHESLILYALLAEYGWKEKRLKRFWDSYRRAHRELIRRYELYDSQGDDAWLCQRKLKEAGIDLDQWDREFEPGREEP